MDQSKTTNRLKIASKILDQCIKKESKLKWRRDNHEDCWVVNYKKNELVLILDPLRWSLWQRGPSTIRMIEKLEEPQSKDEAKAWAEQMILNYFPD